MANTKKTPVVIWDTPPAQFVKNQVFNPVTGANPARYLVDPGTVSAPGKHTAGQLRHARPYLVSGNTIFVFPIGVEGFARTGQSHLSLHAYVGANAIDAQVVMREEGRISLNGTFPGGTAQDTMVNCVNILRSKPPDPGLILYAPGVFETEQYVVPEDWNFTHQPDDRTHSIDYTITLVRIGEGRKVADPHGTPAQPQPTTVRKKPSAPAHYFTVRSGIQTFQQIAKAVYGSTSQWGKLQALNQDVVASFNRSNVMNKIHNLPTYSLPTYRWPIGTRIRY